MIKPFSFKPPGIQTISAQFGYRTPTIYNEMSQAREIYEFLARSENRSVEQALVLAWRRAEEPYRTALLETILDRGKSTATLKFIEQFHQLSPKVQELLAARVESLYGGLYHGARSIIPQTRRNTLTVIRQGRYLPLVELVSAMLRDRDRRISRQAGDVLLCLSKGLVSPNNDDPPPGSRDNRLFAGLSSNVDPVHKRLLISALDKALQDFVVHHRAEAILAAMQVVPVHEEAFWRDRLENYHAVGKTMRQILLTYDRPDIVPFCVSALAHMSLRATAARAIATHQRSDYLSRLAVEFCRQTNKAILQGLKLIRKPRWLTPERFQPERMPPQAQQALVTLVRRLNVANQDKAAFLSALAQKGYDSASLKAVVALSRLEKNCAGKYLEYLVRSKPEKIAVAAALLMRKEKWPQFHQIMLEQFSQGTGKVRELARQYLQELAFDRFWENFDCLPSASRLAGGRAVYKIDPQAHTHWRKKTQDASAPQRLKAVRLARLLGRVDEGVEVFMELAQDRDRKVRSCAVAGLGESKRQHKTVSNQLLAALSDNDNRVRANAIEALEQTAAHDKAGEIARFIQDENNRVRANAIKALLHWKVASAKQAIAQMITDPRPKHRISALWVANQVGINHIQAPTVREGIGNTVFCS